MANIEYRGIPPDEFANQLRHKIVVEMNRSATELFREVSTATPVGVGGQLRQGWQMDLASDSDPVATIGQSAPHFLALELGRKPGKGISQDGQAEVAIWAKRVLGLDEKGAKGFAFVLSRKYKREGRRATGFAGLANPGDIARDRDVENLEPVESGIIAQAFRELDSRLQGLNP